MDDPTPRPEVPTPGYAQPVPATAAGWVPAPMPHPGAFAVPGPVGRVRSTGTCILLMIVTLGFYSWYWYFQTHDEMKRHTGEGLGGGVALILAIFVGFVSPFFAAHEVGEMYQRRGLQRPVSAVTGLWMLLLSWFFLVGAIVWFVKVNGALNAYWRSLGAR